MYAGILYTATAQSQTVCLGICSLNNMCVRIMFENGTCTLYL